MTDLRSLRPRVGIPTLVQGIGLVYPQTRAWRALQEARATHREAGLTKRRKEAMRV